MATVITTEMTGIGTRAEVSEGESSHIYNPVTVSICQGTDKVQVTISAHDLLSLGSKIARYFLEHEENGEAVVATMLKAAGCQQES